MVPRWAYATSYIAIWLHLDLKTLHKHQTVGILVRCIEVMTASMKRAQRQKIKDSTFAEIRLENLVDSRTNVIDLNHLESIDKMFGI